MTIEAYRWVFKNLAHPNNFLPVLVIKPSRKNDMNDAQRCDGYGLSFFDSLANATKKYHALLQNYEKLPQQVGDHVARGMIDPADGVVSKVNREGHFTLHEDAAATLVAKFVVLGRI